MNFSSQDLQFKSLLLFSIDETDLLELIFVICLVECWFNVDISTLDSESSSLDEQSRTIGILIRLFLSWTDETCFCKSFCDIKLEPQVLNSYGFCSFLPCLLIISSSCREWILFLLYKWSAQNFDPYHLLRNAFVMAEKSQNVGVFFTPL